MSNQRLVTEVPSSLKQLARLVVRGFYTIEDALVVDMLVRNPCMKEDDICELLKFEKKMLRSRIAILKNDKFMQIRLKMETGPDGKAQKVNYYFINYKTFVNVVKYKLDMMRKRMETEERDATRRASFKCTHCYKTFTDLEADQLFDKNTFEFRCTFCGQPVEEDMSALPKKDSRLLLAKFNEQLQPLYELLREVEDIKLSPEILEPEPIDIDTIRGKLKPSDRPSNEIWSGEASRGGGFAVEETRVDVSIGDSSDSIDSAPKKERPIWMVESTVITNDDDQTSESLLERVAQTSSQQVLTMPSASGATINHSSRHKKDNEDIMSVLLAHEKQSNNKTTNAVKGLGNNNHNSSDSSEDEKEIENAEIPAAIEMMDEDDSEDEVPTVYIADRFYKVNEITDAQIQQMDQQEKDTYIKVYQEYFSHLYD